MALDPQAPVLVTGATGFIGSHLVDRLVAQGFRVRCLVRRTSSLARLAAAQVELVYGELATGEGLDQAVCDVTAVFHLAGVTKALAVSEFRRGNVQGTVNLLHALESRQQRPRFVHVSSLAAIGPSLDGTPLVEDVPARPLTHYGRSKLEAEKAVRGSPLSANAVILRPPVVYGPRDTDVYQVLRAASRGWLFRLGRDEAFFSYLYVHDLVDALLRAACHDEAAGRTYFVSSPEPASWTQFAAAAASISGRRLRIVSVPGPAAYLAGLLSEWSCRLRRRPCIISREKIAAARCRYWICDPSRARRELGFEARTPLGDGIRETLDWYQQAGWL